MRALVASDAGIQFKAFLTLSAWILLFHLAHILAPGFLRLLWTYVGVHWVPQCHSQTLSQGLLDVLTLTLLQDFLDIPSDFFHRDAIPLHFRYTISLRNLLCIFDPISCWMTEEMQQ